MALAAPTGGSSQPNDSTSQNSTAQPLNCVGVGQSGPRYLGVPSTSPIK